MQQGSIETDGLVGNDCVGMPVEACGEETDIIGNRVPYQSHVFEAI